MSFNYNHITLVGRVENGFSSKPVGETCRTDIRLAVDRPYRTEDGSCPTDKIPVILWGQLSTMASKYFKVGMPVLIEGRLQITNYGTDHDPDLVTEIVAENFQVLEKIGC